MYSMIDETTAMLELAIIIGVPFISFHLSIAQTIRYAESLFTIFKTNFKIIHLGLLCF
jgi:hypothetical protein